MRRFSIPSELPIHIPFRMDMRLLAASIILSVLSAILCGLAPALQTTRAELVNGLKASDADQPGRERLCLSSAVFRRQGVGSWSATLSTRMVLLGS